MKVKVTSFRYPGGKPFDRGYVSQFQPYLEKGAPVEQIELKAAAYEGEAYSPYQLRIAAGSAKVEGIASTKRQLWEIIYPLIQSHTSFIMKFENKGNVLIDAFGRNGGMKMVGTIVRKAKTEIDELFDPTV